MNQFREKFAVSVLAIFLSLGFAPQTRALTFNITYDASVTSLTNAAQIETAFGIATQVMQALYTNPSSVNITSFSAVAWVLERATQVLWEAAASRILT